MRGRAVEEVSRTFRDCRCEFVRDNSRSPSTSLGMTNRSSSCSDASPCVHTAWTEILVCRRRAPTELFPDDLDGQRRHLTIWSGENVHIRIGRRPHGGISRPEK